MESCFAVFIITTVVLLSSQRIPTTLAAPVPEEDGRWVNPCGGGQPISGSALNLPTVPPKPISEELASLKLMALTAVSLCDETSYTIRSRIGTSVANAASSIVLDGFPSTGASYTNGTTIEELFLNEVQRLSKIEVFLEQAGFDTYDYADKIRQVENKNVELLCKMHVTMKGLNQEVTTNVSRDIMPDEYRTLDEISQIDVRNYIMVRGTQAVAVAISEEIDAYLQDNSS
ncbi:uncharacterized protein LOC124113408 [Haliotis rufescens]|uniref:uncharacterized protein LOC124113408 n=1 Tax=Haliotis rufescens TaxID=6454 RepID=UPI001EB06637|nr:uncharacterized protein LOC124113408 [Haliotis rufescens]